MNKGKKRSAYKNYVTKKFYLRMVIFLSIDLLVGMILMHNPQTISVDVYFGNAGFSINATFN